MLADDPLAQSRNGQPLPRAHAGSRIHPEIGSVRSTQAVLHPEISQAAKASPSMVSTLTIFSSGPK